MLFGLSKEEELAIQTYWFERGREAGKVVLPIIGRHNMERFSRWVGESDRRLTMWLEDPAEAARAFQVLRYERWR